MNKPKKPSIYKGVPKDQWASVREAAAKVNAEMPPPPTDSVGSFGDHDIAGAFSPREQEVVAASEAQKSRTTNYIIPDEKPKPAPKAASKPVNSMPTPSAPPRNLFSGQIKSLEVFGIDGDTLDPIPGYRLYWFTDEGGTNARINQAKASGWELVQKDEIAMQDNLVEGNNDVGSVVRKVVNKNRVPVEYGYLMKKPKWLDELHQREMQAVNDRQEQAIRRGAFNSKPEDGRYVAGDVPNSALPKIDISTHLKRPI